MSSTKIVEQQLSLRKFDKKSNCIPTHESTVVLLNDFYRIYDANRIYANVEVYKIATTSVAYFFND